MTRVKLLFLGGYFSSSRLSACGKAPVNVGQYVEITTARVPLRLMQVCANNSLPMFFSPGNIYSIQWIVEVITEPYFLFELACITNDAVF